MLKQPKGLIAAALANTGERFGFYTMMAIPVSYTHLTLPTILRV